MHAMASQQAAENNPEEPFVSGNDRENDTTLLSMPLGDEGHSNGETTDTLMPSVESIAHEALSHAPKGFPPELVVSEERRQVLLGTAPGTPSSDIAVRHTMHFVIRVLKSWPRMMATHNTVQLPPPIHRLQVVDGVPTPLANCYALSKMWAEHTDGTRELVKNTILNEIQRLLSEVRENRHARAWL